MLKRPMNVNARIPNNERMVLNRLYVMLAESRWKRMFLHLVVILGIPSSQLLGMNWIAAILAFILLFFVVGNSLRAGPLLLLSSGFDTHSKLGGVVFDSLISTLFTSSLTLTLSGLWALRHVGTIIIIVVVVSDLMSFSRMSAPDTLDSSRDETRWKTQIRGLIPVGTCLVVGLAVVAWRFAWFTWPESSGTDIFVHLTITEFMVTYGGYNTLFTWYPLGFHTILSSIAIMAGLDPYTILAYGTIVTYPISLTLTYFLCEAVSGSRLKSVMAVALLPFVSATGALLGPHYLLPSTYAYTVAILIILALNSMPRTRAMQSIALLSYGITILVYPYMILGTPPAIAYFWSRKADSRRVRRTVPVLIALACFAAVLFTLVYYLVIPFIGAELWTIRIGMFSFAFSPTLSREVELFQRAYSPLQIALLFSGLVALAIYSMGLMNQKNHSGFDYKGLLLLTSLYLVAFFLPVTAAYRVDMYNRPFMFLCMVEGAFSIVGMAKHVPARLALWNPMESNVTTPAVTLAVVALLIMSAYPTAVAINEEMRWEAHSPRLEELQAFEWLRERMPQGGYILTDPTTGFIMNGFVLRNSSCSMITDDGFYTIRKPDYLWQQVYAFLNASSWDDTAIYENISSYMGGVTYIVISPRTSEWVWRQRNNNPIEFADYISRLPMSDPAWSKFFEPRYTLVQQFGNVMVLVKNEAYLHYNEEFDNVTSWYVNDGGEPESNGQAAFYENPMNPSAWFELFTDRVSFSSQEDLYLEVRLRANTTNLEGRVFGYKDNERAGGYAFYTGYVYPEVDWLTKVWKLTDTPGYSEGPLECVGLGFQNLSNNWTLFVDSLRIYGMKPLNYTPVEEMVVHYHDEFTNITAWSVNAGNPPTSDGGVGQWKNAANPAAWFHLYTDVPSFSSQQGLYLDVRWRANTTDLEGRVFGYREDGREGDNAFCTDYVAPVMSWTRYVWKLSDTPGFSEGALESISFGFENAVHNWTLYIDSVTIFSYVRQHYSSAIADLREPNPSDRAPAGDMTTVQMIAPQRSFEPQMANERPLAVLMTEAGVLARHDLGHAGAEHFIRYSRFPSDSVVESFLHFLGKH